MALSNPHILQYLPTLEKPSNTIECWKGKYMWLHTGGSTSSALVGTKDKVLNELW